MPTVVAPVQPMPAQQAAVGNSVGGPQAAPKVAKAEARVGDAWGLALILGLVLKEAPFLIAILLAALSQIPLGAQMAAGADNDFLDGF